jgi:hypothetical protein
MPARVTKKEFFMKNIIKFLGIIAIAAVVGLTMVSCGDPDAVITLANDSTYNSDALVAVGVYGTGTSPLRAGTASRGSSVSFTMAAGDYRVAVVDGNGLSWWYPTSTSTRYMTGTVRLRYNGTSVVLR